MRKVASVHPESDHRLRVRFVDGFEGVLDMAGSEWTGMAAPLQDPAYFAQARVVDGAVTWPNGYDYCPDAMYHDITGEPVPTFETELAG